MTMRERIVNGDLFTDECEGLPEDRLKAKNLMKQFNNSEPDDFEGRMKLLEAVFGAPVHAWIEPPFYFCYGTNITVGSGTYINFNCNFVDDGRITIGNKVMFGPSVTIATVGHPVHPDYRMYMYTNPVIIEDNCWIGAGAVICPGVTIGQNSVIGAGSVVTKDIPPDSVAVGNPCRVLRQIDDNDRTYFRPDRKILKNLESL